MSIMLPEIDFERIGQRVKQARIDKGYTQAELGEVIGCSNNHMSHIETGQTKVSLTPAPATWCAARWPSW